MKNIKLLLFVSVLLGFLACEKPTYDVDVSIKNHTPYLVHQWKLSEVTQVDAKAGPGQLKEVDISQAVLNTGESMLEFSDGNFTASGFASDLFGASGSWALDNPEFPTSIVVNGGTNIALSRSILEFSKELIVQNDIINCVDNSVSTSYIYTFEKQ
ncbi:MAG: DUF5004 domain-containing protein [Bacteroidota bacterium]